MDATASLVWTAGAGALAVGATGSLHCALMCGPLACAPLPAAGASRVALAAAWHLSRVAAYAGVGLALGLAGRGVAAALAVDAHRVLPWVMAVALLASALELGRRLRPLPGVARLAGALARLGARLPPAGRAAALGAATPFLPCGLLYGAFLAAAATGSGAGGALVMALFALGAVPALAGAQAGASLLGRWPRAAPWLRRAVPLAAAAALVVRALASGGEAPPACH